MGFQGRQGDAQALRPAVVLVARSQEVGAPQFGGARSCAGATVSPVSWGGLEVSGPNIASKHPRSVFKVRRGR